ncbi:ZIP family metal transporter [Flavobacterium agricola]|uniref:ZIP family metal transporter n=1 Tax=Flavobacterium agricola TaxID=2870839 RepID=A0ABY6LZD9_9FLAO|nr:ZIP family metal transporter [Flavobacterium agricola]UYW01684.1 ZIP family metal transporter [Flavobacterium agricola]
MYIFLPFASVIIGYFISLFIKPTENKKLKFLLAFSGAFLLTLTVCHLLPEIFTPTADQLVHHAHEHDHDHGHNHTHNTLGLYIMLGILLQIVLEFFSKGAEHGHVHVHDKNIPYSLFISLCLHALLEGMPVAKHHDLALGIAIHHLPIAIILASFFAQAQLSKSKIFIYMLIFALMTPLGTIIWSNSTFLLDYTKEITAVVIGILFHISATIIFESNEDHKFNLTKLVSIILGILLASFM